ncbi:MAG: hypothetical protein KA383_05445 [Phycisphaerae bacterium]|nr:hypothetical protein [Phycisphaerae bacterium]
MLNDPAIAPHLALLQIHIGDSYATGWGNTRDNFYNVTGTPTAWFDGITSVVGAGSYQGALTAYTGKYNQRRAVATNVRITVTGVQSMGSTFTIRANVCVEPGASHNMRVWIAAVLDHYPSSPTYSRWCFRQAATSQDMTLAPGECQMVARNITFDTTSWANQANIKIVAWAQTPNSSAPAEIFNAAVLSWPFGPDCNFNGVPDAEDLSSGNSADCNLNDLPDECDISSGVSRDTNSNGIPDECETLRGDSNCDGEVNFRDINPFVLALTNWWQYIADFPDCPHSNCDINEDGSVGFQDINPFVNLLTSQP